MSAGYHRRTGAKGRFVATPVDQRFWASVERGACDADCWNWTGKPDQDGYGLLWVQGASVRATHISLELHGKPRPPGAHALHSCDNPACVNPEHLRWGTNAENVQDKLQRGRQRRGADHPLVIDPSAAARGERVGGAILTEDKVREILASSETLVVLGDRYGVDMSTICAIRRGRTWKHVPRPERVR